jgi:ABC-2 type transport system permease protein
MRSLAYARFELIRTFREGMLLLGAFVFPLALYFLIALPNRGVHNYEATGISAPLYYMVSLGSFGTMMAMMSAGIRIAGERSTGWLRQLRIMPLSTPGYLGAKVLTAYVMAALSLALLYVSGLALGVSLSLHVWVEMTVLIAVALLPFAAFGIAVGQHVTIDAIGPISGGTVAILAVLSGTWYPVTQGFLHDIGQFLPSYWLIQAARTSVQGQGWTAIAWAVVLVWTALLGAIAALAYRRDSSRV